MKLKFKKMYFFTRTTRKTISVLHLTQNIQKPEKNSLCCIGPKPYINLKFKIKLFSHGKNQENNLCIAFDSKHTKSRKKLSVLHLNQTILKLKIQKKFSFHEKNQENTLCIAFE